MKRTHDAHESEAEIAEHQAELKTKADAEKAEIEEHALADRTEIDDQAAADRAAVDAKLEAAKPQEEQEDPEAKHRRRLEMLRHVRDEAHVASRQLDTHRLGRAVGDLAELLHEMVERPPKTK